MPGLALRLDSIEARELADLSSVIQDLKFVNACCERLWSEMQKEAAEQDDVLVQALWSAALVLTGGTSVAGSVHPYTGHKLALFHYKAKLWSGTTISAIFEVNTLLTV